MKPLTFVTGSSRGIGREIAIKFASEGYPVAINNAHRSDELQRTYSQLKLYPIPSGAYSGDLGDYKAASKIIADIEHQMGKIGILVNNAGISSIGLFQDLTYQDYASIIQTNLLSAMNCSHLVIPSMIHNQCGKIINISSIWGITGASCEAAYSASKAGINGFTKALGKELAPSNIQVNAIACGVIDTEMNSLLTDETKKALTDEIPAGRFGTAAEVAELVYQIATGPSYLTSQVITLDGGFL